MAAVELKGQAYFQVNPDGTISTLKKYRVITELEQPDIIPIDFLDRASYLDLDSKELYLLSSGELIYDRVIQNWLHSKFRPPSYFEFIWKKIIENGARSDDLYSDYFDSEEDLEDPSDILTREVVKAVVLLEGVETKKACRLVDQTLTSFEGIMKDLLGIDDYIEDLEDSPFLPYNKTLPQEFIQQLALAGILTRTQFNLLTPEQIEEIKKTRVPSTFQTPDPLSNWRRQIGSE